MSRSKKWHREWEFFLGANGRRQYYRKCRGCIKECKQSFRVNFLSCPHYQSENTKNPPDKG